MSPTEHITKSQSSGVSDIHFNKIEQEVIMYKPKDSFGNMGPGDGDTYLLIKWLVYFGSHVQSALPEKIRGRYWPNCHMICRALKIILGERVRVVDGYICGKSVVEFRDLGMENQMISNLSLSIDHSWLELPSGTWIDPFPAGMWSQSPIMFVPYGRYHDVNPGKIYIESETTVKLAVLPEVWEQAERIAQLLSFYPNVFDAAVSSEFVFHENIDELIAITAKYLTETLA